MTIKKSSTKGQWEKKRSKITRSERKPSRGENLEGPGGHYLKEREKLNQEWRILEKRGRTEMVAKELNNLEVEETSLDWSQLNR